MISAEELSKIIKSYRLTNENIEKEVFEENKAVLDCISHKLSQYFQKQEFNKEQFLKNCGVE